MRRLASLSSEMPVEKAIVVIAEEISEKSALIARINVAALVVVVKESPVMKGIEKSTLVILIVIVEKASAMTEVAEEAVSAAAVVVRIVMMVVECVVIVVVIVVEKVLEQVVKVEMEAAFETKRRPSTTTSAVTERLVSHLVALTPLFRVFEDLVSGANFFEFLFSSWVFVLVRMVFDGEFLEGLFDLFFRSGGFDSKDVVVFTFGQRQSDEAEDQDEFHNRVSVV